MPGLVGRAMIFILMQFSVPSGLTDKLAEIGFTPVLCSSASSASGSSTLVSASSSSAPSMGKCLDAKTNTKGQQARSSQEDDGHDQQHDGEYNSFDVSDLLAF